LALLAAFYLGLGIHAAVVVQSLVLTINYAAFICIVYKVAGYRLGILGLLVIIALMLFGLTFVAAIALSNRASI
jgi:hypothetical protein